MKYELTTTEWTSRHMVNVEGCHRCPIEAGCNALCNMAELVLRADKVQQDAMEAI